MMHLIYLLFLNYLAQAHHLQKEKMLVESCYLYFYRDTTYDFFILGYQADVILTIHRHT